MNKFALTTTAISINHYVQIFNFMAPDDGRIEGWKENARWKENAIGLLVCYRNLAAYFRLCSKYATGPIVIALFYL